MMSAASGTIRISTRRRPLHAISQFDKNSGLNPGCKHNKMISPPTHRRVRAGKGCRHPVSPGGPTHPPPETDRPSLRCVAVSSRMNPYRPQPASTSPAYPAAAAGARGPGGRPRHDLAAMGHRTGRAIRPSRSDLVHSPEPFAREINASPPAFLHSLAASLWLKSYGTVSARRTCS